MKGSGKGRGTQITQKQLYHPPPHKISNPGALCTACRQLNTLKISSLFGWVGQNLLPKSLFTPLYTVGEELSDLLGFDSPRGNLLFTF